MACRSLPNLDAVHADVLACRTCPRLVAWREQVAQQKRAAYRDEVYWGRPVPGFGDPSARLLLCGLAPGAHGANRTGRMFTGDRSGDFLYAALHRSGFASQPTATSARDGLVLHDCYITACVRCCPPENKPTPGERDACLPFLLRELEALTRVRCILCLGRFAWDGLLRALARCIDLPRPCPDFAHGTRVAIGPYMLFACYHPSQHNTFTGRLTPQMLDAVLGQIREQLQAVQTRS